MYCVWCFRNSDKCTMSVTIFAKSKRFGMFLFEKNIYIQKKGVAIVQKTENDTREEIQSRGQYLALLHDLPRLKFAWKKKLGKHSSMYEWSIIRDEFSADWPSLHRRRLLSISSRAAAALPVLRETKDLHFFPQLSPSCAMPCRRRR